MTQVEYDKMISDIVVIEHDRVCESLNAIFEREGHSPETLIQAVAQLAENQPATIARVVSAILEKTGILPVDS